MTNARTHTGSTQDMQSVDDTDASVLIGKRSRASKEDPPSRKKQKLLQSGVDIGRTLDATTSTIDSLPKSVEVNQVGTSSSTSNGRAHVRFNSEEPNTNVDANMSISIPPFAPTLEDETREDIDSEDEAPEDVSASAAAKGTRAAAASIAEAVKRQKDQDRVKRQETAARLKEQVASSKRRAAVKESRDKSRMRERAVDRGKRGGEKQEPFGKDSTGIMPESTANVLEDDEVPDLLPDELLAEEFTRPPTPPLTRKPNLHKHADSRKEIKQDKPPKDIRVGPLNVSVLTKVNKKLPPRTVPQSRDIRERWLAGRLVRGSSTTMQRQPFKTTFLAR